MPNNVSKQQLENYLENVEEWVQELKDYIGSIEGETVDIGSNPIPPPPPPPGV